MFLRIKFFRNQDALKFPRHFEPVRKAQVRSAFGHTCSLHIRKRLGNLRSTVQENDQSATLVSDKINGHVFCEVFLDEGLNDVFVAVVASWELKIVPSVIFGSDLLEKWFTLLVES